MQIGDLLVRGGQYIWISDNILFRNLLLEGWGFIGVYGRTAINDMLSRGINVHIYESEVVTA